MDKKRFDVVILGSGSAAFAAAIKASELGANVAMTEYDQIGGTCVNRGCIPSKNLIAAAELVYKSEHPPFRGLEGKRLGVDYPQLIRQKDELVEQLRAKKYIDIAAGDERIEIVSGRARFLSGTEVEVGETVLESEKFLIATGSRPSVPPITGLQNVGFLNSRQAFELKELPKSLIVIGGGYIAMEMSQMFQRLGTQVTVLARSGILRGFEPDVAKALKTYLEEEGIEMITPMTVSHVEGEGDEVVVHILTDGKHRTVRGQHLLLTTGRTPNSDGLGLETVGIQTDEKGFVKVDRLMRTTAENIWAAGDVTGGQLATPVGAREGVIAAENMVTNAGKQMDYRAIPRAVFTDPEVGSVGLTEAEAEAQGIDCRCQSLDLSYVPKAAAVRDTRGVVNMVIERESHKILGVHLIAPRGADIIHEAALAVRFGLTIEDLIETIHVYPTMSEAIRMVAQMFFKDVGKLSCCAE
ncbi:mercury(II) reductase [Candidatus Poribacteria bacterium]|nr:mercury(II) reductase [Candidatus Poribacteria bacterium]